MRHSMKEISNTKRNVMNGSLFCFYLWPSVLFYNAINAKHMMLMVCFFLRENDMHHWEKLH